MRETLLWLLLPVVVFGVLTWSFPRSSPRLRRARRRRDDARSTVSRATVPVEADEPPDPGPLGDAGASPAAPTASAPSTSDAGPYAATSDARWTAPGAAPARPGSALPHRPLPATRPDGGVPVWTSASRLPATAAPSRSLWSARSRWAAMTRRPRTPAAPDPFEALTVQVRLGVLAGQVRALDADAHAYGRGRRLFATQAAYDELLAEACRMAGVEVAENPGPGQMRSEPERFREEMELAARGWSW